MSSVSWVKIVNVGTPCVIGTATAAVDHINKEHGIDVVFVNIFEGWYLELPDNELEYRLFITVRCPKGIEHTYEAYVHDKSSPTGHVKTVIRVRPSYIDPDGKIWTVIPNLKAPCVEDVGKYGVDQHNIEKNDSLYFFIVYDGWYIELDKYTILYRLLIQTKDCLGRIHKYEVGVLEEKPYTVRKRTLKYFNFIGKK